MTGLRPLLIHGQTNTDFLSTVVMATGSTIQFGSSRIGQMTRADVTFVNKNCESIVFAPPDL